MRHLLILLFCTLTACASYTTLSPDEMSRIDRSVTQSQQGRFLKLSFYVTPFFGDGTKRLLTAVPPAEVRLLNDTSGNPINPGEVEKILPAGTKVRITKVEFPTALNVTGRLLYSPRTQPWVYLEAENHPKDTPLILVLRPQIKSQAEFDAELERSLVTSDPTEKLEQLPENVQIAIREKRAVLDMTADALERAWGYPERISVRYPEAGTGSARTEVWTWPGGRRRAELADGQVVRVEGGNGK